MAGGGGNGGLGLGVGDQEPLSVGSYSQLLLSDDVDDHLDDPDSCFNFASSFSSDHDMAPKMLCFGDESDHFNREECDLFFDAITNKISQTTAGITCSDASSATSTTTTNTTLTPTATTTTTNVSSLTKSNKKKTVSAGTGNNSGGLGNGAPAGKQRNCKRTTSADDSTETPPRHAKAKKEKLGERVIALQQLVSPFGKTDTASVLHEAMGYIRFLQDQVQVLCSPYLQRLPSSAHSLEKGEGEARKDLRSRGLCLVPIELMLHVGETNGADFWSPAMVNKLSSKQ